jgi:hypothetical protein
LARDSEIDPRGEFARDDSSTPPRPETCSSASARILGHRGWTRRAGVVAQVNLSPTRVSEPTHGRTGKGHDENVIHPEDPE